MWTRFVNQRDLVWSMPLTRMVGRVVREGASLSKAPQWTGCKRCAELDNCNWFNYEGTRCRLFQCRGNTWGRTTNSYAGPKWKFSPSAQNTYILRSCAWFQEGPDGKALLFGDGGQNKGACSSLILQPTGCPVQYVASILAIVVFALWLYQQSFTSIWLVLQVYHWTFDIVWIY